jgi:hypothetical protein
VINLLPPETKKQVRAARMNVVLVNYCMLICLTALCLAGVFGVGFWADMNDHSVAQAAKDESTNAASEYSATRSAAESFAKNLDTAKTILASNVSFSQLILDIAKVVPSGVILNNLSLGTSAANAPIDINGRAISSSAAVSLKNSLEASPIFENVSITNINRIDLSVVTDPDPLVVKYQYIVSLKAQFSKKTTTTAGAKS